MKHPIAVFIVLTCMLGACASAAPQSANPAQHTPTAAGATATAALTQPPPKEADIDMCALMPLADVQAESPFHTPLAHATSDVIKAGCTYTAEVGAEDPVSVGLVVTTFDSAADALTVLHNDNQTILDRGLATSAISGLGDEAFSYGSDEVGVRAVIGARYVEAHLKGEFPDTADDAKVASATELVRLIISRLP